MANKKVSMKGVQVINERTGNVVTLLNPAQKAGKFSIELKHNQRLTNSLQRKRTKTGRISRLTKGQRIYRAGYLDARKDGAKCYNAKKKKKAQARKNDKG